MTNSDDSDDDLLTTPVFRSSDRRRTLAQKKNGNAIDELIRSSKLHLEEATRIQQWQVENTQSEKEFEKVQVDSASAVKRKVEVTQSGFFSVEETEQLDVPERKRRLGMLQQMKGTYDPVVDHNVFTIVFQPDADAKRFFYFSVADCIKDLRSILSDIQDLNMQQALLPVLEDPDKLNYVLRFLPSKMPVELVRWLFRVALSEGIHDVRHLGRSAHTALVVLVQQRGKRTDLGLLFEMKQLQSILGSWRKNETGVSLTSNKAGLFNLLRTVAQLPLHLFKDPTAIVFQETLTDLCVSLSKSNQYRDVCLVTAAEEVQALLVTHSHQHDDIQQLASRLMKDPPQPDPWAYYPAVAKLIPHFHKSDQMLDTAACPMNVHLSMKALRHCLEGDVLLDDLLVSAFQLIEGVDNDERVDLTKQPLPRKALASSFAGLQTLRSHLEQLNSAKEADSKRCHAVGQASVLAFTSGLVLLGSSMTPEEGGREYGTRENMSFVFRLCDKLGAPLDFLTAYSNRYSADEHFRQLNCWLMVLDFYRLETLKKLKPKFDDDTLIQKNLTSFFTKVST